MENKIDKQINLLFWNLQKPAYRVRLWYSGSPNVYILQDMIGNIRIRTGLTDLYRSEADREPN